MALLHCHFFSETLGMSSSMDVILPQAVGGGQIGMRSRGARREHPVLYLLHGLSDDHTIWQRRTSIERYVAPLGLAVIMPNVHRSFYTDMATGHRYWTFISEELPAVAHSFFPLSSRREDTFVAGLSMGGYGAFKLALRQPHRFAAAASLSGALGLASPAMHLGHELSAELHWAFGEEPKRGGTADDLFFLSEQVAAQAERPLLYQCCGTEDGLYPVNLLFRDHARRLGLPLTFADGPGAHDWAYWDRQIQRVLAWLPLQSDVQA